MNLPSFPFSLKTRTQTLYSGAVTSVSAANALGPFDVLAEHTRTVAEIQGQIVVRDHDQIVYETQVGGALLWVGPESVKVLVMS